MSSKQDPSFPSSLKAVIGQLEDLVKLALEAEKHEAKKDIPFALLQTQLADVKRMIDILNTSFQNTMQEMKLSPEDLVRMRKDLLASDKPEKKIFEKLDALTEQCEEARSRIHKELMENKSQLSALQDESKSSSKKKQARKGKFKSVGSKKGWMPA